DLLAVLGFFQYFDTVLGREEHAQRLAQQRVAVAKQQADLVDRLAAHVVVARAVLASSRNGPEWGGGMLVSRRLGRWRHYRRHRPIPFLCQPACPDQSLCRGEAYDRFRRSAVDWVAWR